MIKNDELNCFDIVHFNTHTHTHTHTHTPWYSEVVFCNDCRTTILKEENMFWYWQFQHTHTHP